MKKRFCLSSVLTVMRCDIMRFCYVVLRFKSFLVVPYKNIHMRFHRSSQLQGGGRLFLGLQWKSGRYLQSQLVMKADSKLKVTGRFKVMTGHTIWINDGASLVLGSGFINNGLNLSCFSSIEIGDDVAISENLTIRDSDNHCVDGSDPTAPIKIGNKVWIGINVTILKGVTIGDGAVIAAGALVNRDIPPNSMAAGVPAVVKKSVCGWS